MNKTLSLLLLLGLFFSFSACSKEEEDIQITEFQVSFISPSANETLADPANANFQLEVSTPENIHGVQVFLYLDGDSSYIAPFSPSRTPRDGDLLEINEQIDLSAFPAGSQFRLEVKGCLEHGCPQPIIQSIPFNI
ncbi:hypothetical protein [Saprospira grandis]|uniref:Lipoprotein n=1 Tax=Saprospira grandis (strain Lewin) TaxID=984262 RepID=H6L6I1_SAPGL|nr:hypothetical protein [Saprospira grandis]AFC24123.1 hypothetical protein SGRA_1388 [Saprospira grandis str. Lewin]WBM75655.1 hypothetical protein OP864_05300 [Saprospira grandis]